MRNITSIILLERHVPVDVLPDASADSFAAWLQGHHTVNPFVIHGF